MKNKRLTEKEYEDVIEEVLKVTDFHANILLMEMNNLKVDFPELYFQSMIIYMIDGLSQLDIDPDIIKDHIEKHLNGHTYFYSKENNIVNKLLH